jgi:Flp pilus assembly protein TadB
MANALIIVAGVGLLGYVLLDEFVFAARPQLRQRTRQQLSQLGHLPWTAYIPLPIALVLAYLMRDSLLIGFFLAVVGFASSYYLAQRAREMRSTRIDREIITLVESFRSLYRIRPAIFSALEEARKKIDEPLRSHVTAAVQTFYVTSSQEKAFSQLRRRTNNPYLNQFVYILERSDDARREAVLDALQDLLDRLRRREDLRRQTETDLTMVTLQTRLILGISVIVILAIALIDPLRTIYTGPLLERREAPLGRQLLFCGVVTIAIYTAYRIDRRIKSLKERVL